MKDRFELLVFDWDGTLFDSIGWIVECLQRAAAECGLPIPEEAQARSVIGLGIHEAMATLYPGAPAELTVRLAGIYRRHYGTRSMAELGLFAGVREMLEELRGRGFRLGVATGKGRAGLDHCLGAIGMETFFDATRCADETASKPDPTMLLQIMDELSVAPERTLMIGDSVHDLGMARNAGVAAVGVGCGANVLEELAEWQPLACFGTTVEILGMFGTERQKRFANG